MQYILAAESPADVAKTVAAMSPEDQREIAAGYAELGRLSSEALITATEDGLAGTREPSERAGARDGRAYVDAWTREVAAARSRMTAAASPPAPDYRTWVNNSGARTP